MISYVLFDDAHRNNLLPLTFTRPVCELRTGILRIREKWEYALNAKCSFSVPGYLSHKYPMQPAQEMVFINGSVLPNHILVQQIQQLPTNNAIVSNDRLIAVRIGNDQAANFNGTIDDNYKIIYADTEIRSINRLWELFTLNADEIQNDLARISHNRKSSSLSSTVQQIGDNIFVEVGFKGEFFTLNASTGPIYLGKNAEVMEGAVIRGPFALCENATVKMSAKIYGATTIGPHCKVGGEIGNSVFLGYANKAHDGYLGNAVIGEWCNLGADTNNSNLKNNYEEVKLWNYAQERFEKTGLQFCGLVMGDHSKCGINTMFNTGTVIGVSANIFGSGFPRNFIPSFAWGGAHGFTVYAFKRAADVARKVMARRGIDLDLVEEDILENVFNQTEKYRKF